MIRRKCHRCGEAPDDLWVCRVETKTQLLCPGCVADRRNQGAQVVFLKEAE